MDVFEMLAITLVVSFFFCGAAFPLEEDRPACVTPNGEKALCVPVTSCRVISEALYTRNTSAVEFAQKSQCESRTREPHVCCGTKAYFRPIFEIFTDEEVSTTTESDRWNVEPRVKISTSENNRLPDKSVCGLESADNRIVGGKMTEIGEFPWMVLLRYKNLDGEDAGFHCGGSVINNRYVLTAAHCLKGSTGNNLKIQGVRLGEWNISSERDCFSENECADSVVDIEIEEEVVHPYFDAASGGNDIALLRLTRDFQFTEYIRPICIPTLDDSVSRPNATFTVSGWGTTLNGTQSEVKLKVQVPLVDDFECKEKIRAANATLTPSQMCAGGEKGKDTCKGDSGGPLMSLRFDQQKGQRQWYQEGIVSRGIGCGSGYPAIYTKVAQYLDWIKNNLEA